MKMGQNIDLFKVVNPNDQNQLQNEQINQINEINDMNENRQFDEENSI